MLVSLSIENYALIDKLQIGFSGGLSIITGETGAGKSILLGALGLIIGQRADTGVLKDESRNCIVEGEFAIGGYGLEQLFVENDIDYSPTVTIRRMIAAGGKSRAFVNDVPVTLNLLKELGERLIDIHSQHQNLLLNTSAFQLSVIDAQAAHDDVLQKYRKAFVAYRTALAQLNDLQDKASSSKANYDYMLHQYNELNLVQLKHGEQQGLEDEQKQLAHAEEIKLALTKSSVLLQGDEAAADNLLREAQHTLQRIANVWPAATELGERIGSCRVELRDVANEVEAANERIATDSGRLEFVETRLNVIYSLQQKHRVDSVESLIELTDSLEDTIRMVENFDQRLAELQTQCSSALQKVKELATKLSDKRTKTVPTVTNYVTTMLRTLGMPHAVFTVAVTPTEQYMSTGCDVVQFLFSANKEMAPQEISRVASGGEMSRLMLSLKSLLAKQSGLPTIIFDEIDTGVSGEVADKMGGIIANLSQHMQVINITHLPQIASKGSSHFVVYKEIGASGTAVTCIKALTPDERVHEIAKMLSGERITDAAMANARELLGV